MEDPSQLKVLIDGCLDGNREAQRMLYQHYYGYGMSVCLRYSKSREESREILNDGFMKVFTRLRLRDEKSSFKSWLRRIMINSSIDHYRKNSKHYNLDDVSETMAWEPAGEMDAIGNLTHQELIELVRGLSPAYRAVFNLYVIDGYTHEEIASRLEISVGTSKSNLFKARENLKAALHKNKIKRYA
ncbi:MAG: sigma-70 family RNA polymerase sigma factor [Chryseolinea sp.]